MSAGDLPDYRSHAHPSMAGPIDLANALTLRHIPFRAPRDEGEGAAAFRAIMLRLHQIH